MHHYRAGRSLRCKAGRQEPRLPAGARTHIRGDTGADDLVAQDGSGRLRAHETHAHQAVQAARAGERNQGDAGMRGLLHLPEAWRVDSVGQA